MTADGLAPRGSSEGSGAHGETLRTRHFPILQTHSNKEGREEMKEGKREGRRKERKKEER